MDSEIIFNRIDKLRQSQGLSLYALAKKAGINCASLYKWRDKKSSPSLYLIESLCYVLGINIINLFIKNEDLVYLQDSEKELFDLWHTLKVDQKLLVIELIKSFTKK